MARTIRVLRPTGPGGRGDRLPTSAGLLIAFGASFLFYAAVVAAVI